MLTATNNIKFATVNIFKIFCLLHFVLSFIILDVKSIPFNFDKLLYFIFSINAIVF